MAISRYLNWRLSGDGTEYVAKGSSWSEYNCYRFRIQRSYTNGVMYSPSTLRIYKINGPSRKQDVLLFEGKFNNSWTAKAAVDAAFFMTYLTFGRIATEESINNIIDLLSRCESGKILQEQLSIMQEKVEEDLLATPYRGRRGYYY